MASDRLGTDERDRRTRQNIAYIREMLGELRQVAEREHADMLCYLIEMAYVEAGDVQSGKRALSFRHEDGDQPSRMPI
ncbi:hypothetical protein [Rhizobium halophytocola]|uniref:Metal-sensing transcriptional repressor n=1 Tax=Rhizobium halophytocola TaxID=735519 RepID=A0ABS4DY19_9HYPH|nr:hypothetical protein [Rhizobium halophytocola]MBP1850588.1 hypothetical protein [Rhizobium halophytocola]